MVLKAAILFSAGTAFGMYLAQEYEGMPNVKKVTTGLVRRAANAQSIELWCLLIRGSSLRYGHFIGPS